MKLSDTAVKNVKASDKAIKMADGGGLYLEVTPKGGKYWRQKYRFQGKEKRLAHGVYPDVSLKMARDRRDDARRLLADGIDPGEHKKSLKEAELEITSNTFEAIAREWLSKQSHIWSKRHVEQLLKRLERNIFPWVGQKPISQITAKDILSVLRRIENNGKLHSAHRALSCCSQIFRYSVAIGKAPTDPCRDLRGALPPEKVEHRAAITDPVKVGDLLKSIDGYEGSIIVKCAMQLAPLVFVRPGELRQAKWEDIDLEQAEWRFTITKTNTPHIVPLSRQSIAILSEIKPVSGKGLYVFPSQRTTKRPMSDNAVLVAMRAMGIPKEVMSGHGFRAMARTLLDEVLGFRPDFIEHQLAHAVRDPNGRAYNRTSHLEERKKMMQEWADYLDKLKGGAEIIAINQ